MTTVVLSANDPVAAWGGVKILRERFHIEPAVVTGPATDNSVGVDIIEEQMKVRAFNALTNGAALGDHLIEKLGLVGQVLDAGCGLMSAPVPTIVLGGTGYVAGELLRLVAGHPSLKLAGILRTASRVSRWRRPSVISRRCIPTRSSRRSRRSSSWWRRCRVVPSSRPHRMARRPR